MIPVETQLLFITASVALALAPGPDNIFVLTQSALHGRSAGLLVTLGLCTGLLVHTSAVALGVAAVIQTSATAFNALKIVGALYLLYLAWQVFRADATALNGTDVMLPNRRKLYYRGVLMNITNPKVAIFFLAFLPQFTDASAGPITLQILLLGGLFIVATLVVFGTVAWSGGYLAEKLKKSTRAQIVMNRVAGTIFTGLALRLVFSQQ